MSSEGENGKKTPTESVEKNKEETNDVKKDPETKVEEKADKAEEPVKTEEKAEKNDKVEPKAEDKKEEEKVEKEPAESEEAEESDKEEEEEEDEKNDKEETPEKSTKDNKKANSKNNEEKEGKAEIPNGSGTELGEIPRIDASISRFKNDDLKLLHKLLFKNPGKTPLIKKNIRKFNGFDFKKDSDEYNKKLASIEKFETKQLKIVCEMLDLEKKGNKEEMSERILEYLIEPKDSGKAVGGGRPKRTAAVKANNRGYSSHDESYSSDEKHTPRARRNAGKRANLKEETSSESDEEFRPSEASEEERPAVKRPRLSRKKKADSEEEDASEVDSPSSEESDDGPKNKKKKVVNSKVKPKASRARPTPKKAAATPKKKTPARKGKKRAQESSEEEGSERDEEGSSSEDEPLAKKTVKAPQPPTDEEIKTYVKEILEGANLEEITMKTVCKQVYAHYPDFDLTHKKDYIKTTVKSLIST